MTLSGSSGHSSTASCAITCSTGSQTHIHTTTLCKLTHSHRRVSPPSLIFMLQHIRNLILIALDTQSSSCSSSSSSSSWSLSSAHEFRMFVAKSAIVHFRFLFNADHFCCCSSLCGALKVHGRMAAHFKVARHQLSRRLQQQQPLLGMAAPFKLAK